MRRAWIALLLLAGCGDDTPPVGSVSGARVEESDHAVTTADGWRLALHRYRPALIAYAEPVLLTHGFIENRRIWDLDPQHSLALTLAAAGFDVWTLDLRGGGESQAPPVADLDGWTFTIDDFVRFDAPAAVDHVLAQAGAGQLFFCGHSMGGLVAYGYVETGAPEKVRGVATLAGAGHMSGGLTLQFMLLNFYALLGAALGPVIPEDAPFATSTALHAMLGDNDEAWLALGRLLDGWLGRPYWDEGNVTPELLARMLREASADTSTNVVKQFLAWTSGAPFVYRDLLPTFNVPLLAVAGASDMIVPPPNVRYVVDHVSSPDKTYLELGGFGHEDLCWGERAPVACYPALRDWLAARATPR